MMSLKITSSNTSFDLMNANWNCLYIVSWLELFQVDDLSSCINLCSLEQQYFLRLRKEQNRTQTRDETRERTAS